MSYLQALFLTRGNSVKYKKNTKKNPASLVRITANVEPDLAKWLDKQADQRRLPQASYIRMILGEMKAQTEQLTGGKPSNA
jgi:hypothetical protein